MKDRIYKERDVNGLMMTLRPMDIKKCAVTVRMTSDKRGKSLSLSGNGIMLSIPLEAVSDIIKEAE